MTTSTLLRCVAGPDSGWTIQLEPGTHWLGRVDGGVRVLDPAVEAHHAIVAVDRDGRATLLQTTGRAPILIDGHTVRGWVPLHDRSTIEVGGTRLQVGAPPTVTGPPVEWVFDLQDHSDAELARFERDVRLAANTARRLALTPAAGTVELGVAEVDLEVVVRRADGTQVDAGDLDHTAHAIIRRECRATVPVRVALLPEHPVAIVGHDPAAIAAALVAQLESEERARVLVADAAESEQLVGTGRPLLALAHDLLDVPPGCRAVLDVGSTWRATWCADVIDHPDENVRLHARGRAPHRVFGRVGCSPDVDRSIVAQEVAGTRAELGGDVVRVPQAARRQ